jgi:hypothetical protein
MILITKEYVFLNDEVAEKRVDIVLSYSEVFDKIRESDFAWKIFLKFTHGLSMLQNRPFIINYMSLIFAG